MSFPSVKLQEGPKLSHDIRRDENPKLGPGCHFHVLSGQPLIKLRAVADHTGVPSFKTHTQTEGPGRVAGFLRAIGAQGPSSL